MTRAPGRIFKEAPMRTICLLLVICGVLTMTACDAGKKPILVTGKYLTTINGTPQDTHEFSDTDIKSLNGYCKFDKDTKMFALKFSDGGWSNPNTTYYFEAVDVTDSVPKSLQVMEGGLRFQPTSSKFHCTQNHEYFTMDYVDDQDAGETYYILKFNCSGESKTIDDVMEVTNLTNLQSGTGGIKLTRCDGY